jgi:hypothetical protein
MNESKEMIFKKRYFGILLVFFAGATGLFAQSEAETQPTHELVVSGDAI